MDNHDKDREITFSIEEHIGIIADDATGWKKELNKVSWNGGPAKFDIRSWDGCHAKMTRGITLHKDEMAALQELIRDIEF